MTNLANRFPTIPHPTLRLAIVGESPSTEECVQQEHLLGYGADILRRVLSNNSLSLAQCFLGNISQTPTDSLDPADPAPALGLDQLTRDLTTFRPHCILLLGRLAFRAFFPDKTYENDRSETIIPLDDWRSSILPHPLGKCIPTYAPFALVTDPLTIPLLRVDVRRAARHAGFSEIRPTPRTAILTPSLPDVISWCQSIIDNNSSIGFDIEGYPNNVGITCLSFCPSGTTGIVIPFWDDTRTGHMDHYWSEAEEPIVWYYVAKVLAAPNVSKRCHNSLYEYFVLAWSHKLLLVNVSDDTMLKSAELLAELGKSLGLAISIFCEEPFYKDERTSRGLTALNYNFKDSALTHELSDRQEVELTKIPPAQEHYRFNIRLLPAFTYMHLRGCNFNQTRLAAHRENTEREIARLSTEISEQLGRPFNVKSVDDKRYFLYGYTKPGAKKEQGGPTLNLKPSSRDGMCTNEVHLLRAYSRTRHPAVRSILQCIAVRTRLSDINKLSLNEDGRIRTSYDPVGAVTHRLSSRESMALEAVFSKRGILSWDNTGTNMQNVTKELRDCFIPDDEGSEFWQFDLSGADGWTVAADLAALGNPTMLDDYLFGLKPALILHLMLDEYEAGRPPQTINSLDRAELKTRCKALKSTISKLEGTRDEAGRPGDWKYLCMKRVQHGTNYGAKPETVAQTIFKDSDGYVDLPPTTAQLYQAFYKMRYSIDARFEWIERQLRDKGYIETAAGHRRLVFGMRGRTVDNNLRREIAASEPQTNTTFVTNLALEKLYYSPTNRRSSGAFFVEPLLQIHDALAGQYPTRLRSFAHDLLSTSFRNPITIHGIPITIPAEGNYGPDWRNCKTPIN